MKTGKLLRITRVKHSKRFLAEKNELVPMRILLRALILSIIILVMNDGVGHADNLWSALKSRDHFVLIRHSLAPGYGDPDHFKVEDCKTQRNLNDSGRRQSKGIGDLFRLNGISSAFIFSSQWCRCLETARLLGLGQVSELPALNSFFQDFERGPSQTQEIKRWIKTVTLRTPTVLVSHQVNITSLIGYTPASGEIVFVRREHDGSLSMIGSIATLL